MDARSILFPQPEQIAPLAMAFARMMFAHAQFEREICQLQGAITCDRNFGEQRRHQWGARERPERMAELIANHLGTIAETTAIKQLLTDAIAPCDDRSLLAHGEWWRFDPDTSVIEVRGGTQWKTGCVDYKSYTVADISAVAARFDDLEIELFKLRRGIEERPRSSGANRGKANTRNGDGMVMTARKLLALAPIGFAGLAAVLGFYVAFTPKSLDDLDGPNWWAMVGAAAAFVAAVLSGIDRWKR
jgi:hypothetical protein